MLGNIGKICEDKKDYILKHQKNALKKQINKQEMIFQTQAIQLIQKQMTVTHLLSFNEVFETISRKRKRDSFERICSSSVSQQNLQISLSNQKKRSIKLFEWKISKIRKQKQTFFKIQFLKNLERRSKVSAHLHKIAQITDKYQCRTFFSQSKHLQSEKSLTPLIFLDISQICPKQRFTSVSDRLIHHLKSGKQNQDLQQLSALRKQIIRKQQEINDYQKEQDKQISQLKQKLNKRKLRQASTDETFSLEKTQDVIISKLIRKNFELQQQIQSVYQLLRTIEQNKTSKFGMLLYSLTKKRHLNIELQKIEV